jgi:RNA polymerase sigma factor (sigma-70 family)
VIDPYANAGGERVELSTTSITLLDKLRAADPAGWRRMVRKYGQAIHSWCILDGLKPEDAADVAQEILVAAYEKLGTFRHDEEGASFRGWLRRIAWNKAADFRRRAVRRPWPAAGGSKRPMQMPAPGENDFLTGAASDDVATELIEAVRARTDERTWQIFTCYMSGGCSAAMTAEAFGVTVGYVYGVRCRILKRFREENEKRGNPMSRRRSNS